MQMSYYSIDYDEAPPFEYIDIFGRELKPGDYALYGLNLIYHDGKEDARYIYEAPLFQVEDREATCDKPHPQKIYGRYQYVYKICNPSEFERKVLEHKCILNDFYDLPDKKVFEEDIFLRKSHPGDFVLYKKYTFLDLPRCAPAYGILVSNSEAFTGSEVIDVYGYYIIENPSEEEVEIKEKLMTEYKDFIQKRFMKRRKK